MEQNTILWIVAFITLPLTIPLAIMSCGIILSVLWIVICLFFVFIEQIFAGAAIMIILYVAYKWLSRNG